MSNLEDVLILKEGPTGFLLRSNMKYQKIRIAKGIIKNNLNPRESAFVKANIPGYYLNR